MKSITDFSYEEIKMFPIKTVIDIIPNGTNQDLSLYLKASRKLEDGIFELRLIRSKFPAPTASYSQEKNEIIVANYQKMIEEETELERRRLFKLAKRVKELELQCSNIIDFVAYPSGVNAFLETFDEVKEELTKQADTKTEQLFNEAERMLVVAKEFIGTIEDKKAKKEIQNALTGLRLSLSRKDEKTVKNSLKKVSELLKK